MWLGNLQIKPTAALAPMAGVADTAFRQICKQFGAAYMVGEMASAKGMEYSTKKTASLLGITPQERPCAVQLFGDDPGSMARAAVKAMEYMPDAIDLNMGCPAPKVAGNGGGAALMKQPLLAGRITEAVARAVNVPVTVKFRKGWDSQSVNAVEFAKIMEESGAAALTIHGRTREQFYAPLADWDIIAAVKQAVRIPVIGNGDCVTAMDVANMYAHTGCDLVMVGRGALGNPWIFAQCGAYLTKGILPASPPLKERMDVMLRHLALICRYKGEKRGMREARKHAAWYMKGLRGAARLRRLSTQMETYDDARRLALLALEGGTLEEAAGREKGA